MAGERRLRAVTRLGWTEIPAVVRDFDDRAMLTLALVENLQRADLNPLEEAEGYQRLIDEFGLTQLQVADAVGKDRTSITNLLRVLSLPLLSANWSRVGTSPLVTPEHCYRSRMSAASSSWLTRSWRISSRCVRSKRAPAMMANPAPAARRRPTAVDRPQRRSAYAPADPAVKRIEDQLRKRLQTDVQVQLLGNDRGVVRITFYSADDLERLLDAMVGPARSDFD